MKNIRRFTLVELLAVVALIAILSAIGFGSYSFAMGRAKESATQALMKQLEAGLESFHAKNGYYPPSGGNYHVVNVALASDGAVSDLDFGGTGGKFTYATGSGRKARLENERLGSFTKAVDMEVIRKHLGASGDIEDAWGGKIYYCAPGKINTASFDLISAGPDEKFSKGEKNTPGEIAASEGKTLLEEFRDKSTNEAVCDDLFNF